jgi:hypothetical protein
VVFVSAGRSRNRKEGKSDFVGTGSVSFVSAYELVLSLRA